MTKHTLLWTVCAVSLLGVACGGSDAGPDVQDPDDDGGSLATSNPFADRVISFTPGAGAGFGQDLFPNVVLGPPQGMGASQGSLDVLSLGRGGTIVLEFTDLAVTNGPGVDLLVFENAFLKPDMTPFAETGVVEVSDDNVDWRPFPCQSTNKADNYPGCAGVTPVYSHPDNGLSPTDPAVAGGDGFDLATVGLSRARFVRIRDSGSNGYAGNSGGFDLDAVAVVNGVALGGSTP